MLKIKIKRFDKDLPIPEYKTSGAVAFDLYSRETVTINPGEIAYISLNVAIEIPQGYFVLITSRSSAHKLGIMMANGVGIGDADFIGDNDEYKYAALNFTKDTVTIERGSRIAQAMILPVEHIQIIDAKKLESKDRGGFGTTGIKA